MSEVSPSQVTELLAQWTRGDKDAPQVLLPLVYGELRRLARYHLGGERSDHTLQSTALVHEAYLRLVKPGAGSVQIESRRHFFAVASRLMREILVDYARNRGAAKRDGGEKLTLDEASELTELKGLEKGVDLLALDDALNELAKLSPRQSRIVELKFFGGLSVEEIGQVVNVSRATVERDWSVARAWLYRAMSGTACDGS
ncbi:MAG TPA: sigma-70 family RNA polymerase sigma factor [Terriglobales bacterium]|nr:sigma-70 family RNA polymerase sigma factor [Terriglobales bacterium]